jgi:hypothetical protein
MRPPLVVALSLFTAGTAAAEPMVTATTTATTGIDIGARIGGYGFRREGDKRPGEGWTECRMNGLGLFASKAMRGPLFVEAGLDLYSSSDFPTGAPAGDLPVDRASGLLSSAIGVRSNFTSWLRGYAQLGAGLELTKVSVPYGESQKIRDTKVMPAGFFGVGVDVRIGKQTYIGSTFRTLVMGNFDYDAMTLETREAWQGPPTASEIFDASPDLAAQAQFYLRRDL